MAKASTAECPAQLFFWDVTQRPPRCVTFQKTAAEKTKTDSKGDVSYSEGQRVTQNVKHGTTSKARNRAKQGLRSHVRGTGSSEARDEESCERHARGQVKRGGWNI